MIRLPAEIAGLRPALDVDGRRIRLAVVWAVTSVVATAAGPVVAAVTFGLVALGAAGQACRAWRREQRRPHRPVAIGGAVLVSTAGAIGPLAVVASAAITGALAVAARARRAGDGPDAAVTTAIALVSGISGGAIPLARAELGATAALVLLVTVLVADASWFVIGTGSRRAAEAPVASTAAVAAVSIATAAVLVPPFRGASPLVLGMIAAVLIPFGPHVASAVLPRVDAFAPALRRIDSFVLVGPVWVLAASLLLDLP